MVAMGMGALAIAFVDSLIGAGVVDGAAPSVANVARPAAASTSTTDDAPSEGTVGSVLTGPEVVVDPQRAALGERFTLTITGFGATSVTVSLCGNGALRGSADCNMIASTGLRLNDDDSPTIAVIPVVAPPMPCPCVVRVSSPTNDEIAVTPVTVVGHPVEETVDSGVPDTSIVASIRARRRDDGAWRRFLSSLGGDTRFEVTVSVTNTSAAALDGVTVDAVVGRGGTEIVAAIPTAAPGSIGPGRTWQYVTQVTVPGREFGTLSWRVEAAVAGRTSSDSSTTSHRPALLMLLAIALVAYVAFRMLRARVRHHAARDAIAGLSASSPDPLVGVGTAGIPPDPGPSS